jgi:ATP phosphoribosyltransferase regulatory subunit
MIATRLAGMPAPLRLAYEGKVLRRRGGRARAQRQIPQVGVELAGVAGQEGDLELLSVAVDALRAAGLPRFTLDVGDAGIVRALLADTPGEVARGVSEALARKDQTDLVARGAGLAHLPALVALLGLHGKRNALAEGQALLAKTPARHASLRLLALADAAEERGLGEHLVYDLGEVKHFDYYTGVIFHAYAPGVGEAIGAGGRYDDLLGRFGAPMPAVGFALDLDRLAVALAAANVVQPAARRVVVVGPSDDPRLAELRAQGVAAVDAPTREAALAYAAAWGFTEVL